VRTVLLDGAEGQDDHSPPIAGKASRVPIRALREADHPRWIAYDVEARGVSTVPLRTLGGRNVSAIATAPRPMAAEPMNIHA
jgi:hypothetical protein